MIEVNSFYDYIRLLNLGLCVVCLVIMGVDYYKHNDTYNEKTRDLWYSRVMWALAGIVISFEGIRRDFPFTTIPLFVFIASIVTLKGLIQSGSWGSDEG